MMQTLAFSELIWVFINANTFTTQYISELSQVHQKVKTWNFSHKENYLQKTTEMLWHKKFNKKYTRRRLCNCYSFAHVEKSTFHLKKTTNFLGILVILKILYRLFLGPVSRTKNLKSRLSFETQSYRFKKNIFDLDHWNNS